MATVNDVLMRKPGGMVHTVSEHLSVLEATQLMNLHQVGALVVTEGERVAGMFTERDVLRRVVAEQRDPASTPVGEVMTRHVLCSSPDEPLDRARSVMMQRRVRHLPVLDEGGVLVGMISIGDLNAWSIEDGEGTIQYMEEYIYGRG